MFAARQEQENAIHSRPGGSKHQPKTPGPAYPNTPFRLARNDENAKNVVTGKKPALTAGRHGSENLVMTKGKDAQHTWATPLGMCFQV